MKRIFQVTLDIVFDDDGEECIAEDIEKLTDTQIGKTIEAGLQSDAAYDMFGESLSMAGMQTPTIYLVEEVEEE